MIDLSDVLLAMSNIPVDDPIAEIWGRQIQGGYKIIEYTGSLPITIRANGDALIDYRIYGNTVQAGTPTPENPITPIGCGERTENLWDRDVPYYVYAKDYKRYNPDNAIALKAGTYTISSDGRLPIIQAFDANHTQLNINNAIAYNLAYYSTWDEMAIMPTVAIVHEATITLLLDCILTFCVSGGLGTYLMLNLGSTALPYEPYGYKLPMTVYKQEFMVTGDMLDQSNWVLSPHADYAPSYFMYFDISDVISKGECDVKTYENFTQGYVPRMLVVALTDDMYALVDTKYRILNNDGVILNKKFDFSSWDKIYLCIGYGNGFTNNAIKQSKIDEFFENWKILIAPTSQTRESPVYIGENQLGEDEYVSFSEQKIYRNVSGTLTPTDPPVPLPEIPTIDGETVIDYDGDPKPSQMYVKYKGKG